MKIKKHKKSERGFAIALALLLLVVMSLMGATLVMVASSDHKQNTLLDSNQQAFYAAETGITIAKKWIVETSSTKTLSPGGSPAISFCKTNFFPNLDQGSIKAINNPATNQAHVSRNTLNSVISGTSTDEQKRLAKYSYEFFITYTPDSNGNTDPNGNPLVPRTKQVTGTMGSSVAESTSYKTGGTSMATYYTIFSCGKGENDTIVPLEAVVTLVQ
jgi:Tfp pilus assembly protein PilX